MRLVIDLGGVLGGLALGLMIIPASPSAAQAPASVDDAVYHYTQLTTGISVTAEVIRVLKGDGTFTQIYRMSSIASVPEMPAAGTYTYAKIGANSATLSMALVGSSTATLHTLVFTSASAGSFTHTFGGGPFRLTSLPLSEPLVNTSQRCWVSQGEPGIIGFVVPPQRSTVVLVRAVGPGLAAFPGTTPAADPELEVYADGHLGWTNDDWERRGANATAEPSLGETVAAISNFVGAFPLAPGSLDAAIVLVLPRGSYTVHVRNAAGVARGEILGEVYVVD